MISHADLDAFSRATLELYAPTLEVANYPNHVVAFLRELVGADMVCVASMQKKDGTLGVHFSDWDPGLPALLEGFGRTMAKYPLFNWDPTVNGGKPFFRRDYFSARQFRDLDIYSESFRHAGWINHCAVHVPTDDHRVVFIGLERSGTVDYTERDRVLLRLAQTHLANACQLARARTAARSESPPDPTHFERAGFSPRESEVLVWLTEGKTNAEMAALLGVTTATIKFHLTAIFNKIGVGNRLAATLYALDLSKHLRGGADSRYLSVKLRS